MSTSILDNSKIIGTSTIKTQLESSLRTENTGLELTVGSTTYRWNGTSFDTVSISGAALVADGDFATIIVSSGGSTYIAKAVVGASATAAVWSAKKIDSSGSVTWADGNNNYDNTPGAAGVSLSGLTYT